MEFIIWLSFVALIGAAIGQARGRTAAGFWWGFLLGPIGWFIVLLGPNFKREKRESNERAQELRMQAMQEAHLAELRALRKSLVSTPNAQTSEDAYWIRLKDKDIGPIGEGEMIELYSTGKITLETEVARDDESGEKAYRCLGDEIPALKKLIRKLTNEKHDII